ncbi:MAG: DNA recombination protein RmuC [Bacteroidales bacterium]
MDFLYFFLGVVTGGLILWGFLHSRTAVSEASLAEKDKLLREISQESQARLAGKEREIVELTAMHSAAQADLKNLEQKLLEQKQQLEETQKQMSLQFESLANRILEEKTQKFTDQNKTRLEEILKPLGEKIKDFRDKVELIYGDENRQRFHLGKEIEKLMQLNQVLGDEAKNLTRALKGESKTQGNWGEMILENILEKSGLVKNREYEVQASFTGEDGKRMQPDILVRYPGNRTVVIDSKVSLTAYERFATAEDPGEQEKAAKDHLLSVKKHIQELGQKNYENIYHIRSLDFVMLFLPVEPAYYLALQADPALWHYAYERRILLMSPTNLLAALKMIESLWRIENQNENALEIARQSGDMLDKFVSFVEDLKKVGSKIDDAHNTWDEAMRKLSSGKGNLVNRARRIQELGTKSKKQLPLGTGSFEEPGEEETPESSE